MSYYWLFTHDQRNNNYTLHEDFEDEEGRYRIRLREPYRAMACQQCGKIDEAAALRQWVDPAVKIRARADIFHTSENILCVSDTLKGFLEENDICGVDYIPIAGQRYYALLPTQEINTDAASCGMDFLNRCETCGRFEFTRFWPNLKSIDLPSDPRWLICPTVHLESAIGREFTFLASETVFELLKANRFKAIDYHERPAK